MKPMAVVQNRFQDGIPPKLSVISPVSLGVALGHAVEKLAKLGSAATKIFIFKQP
jgi:hypothetical protein